MDPVLLNSGMSFDPKEISIDEYWFRKRSEACQILYERLIDVYNSLTLEKDPELNTKAVYSNYFVYSNYSVIGDFEVSGLGELVPLWLDITPSPIQVSWYFDYVQNEWTVQFLVFKPGYRAFLEMFPTKASISAFCTNKMLEK